MKVNVKLAAALIAALYVTSIESAEPQSTAEMQAKQSEPEGDADRGPPWACPVAPMFTDVDGVTWYYANLHFSNSCDNPTPCYLTGNLNWPHPCPRIGCVTARYFLGSRPPYPNPGRRFDGLDSCVPEDYKHDDFPQGPARRYLEAFEIPSLKFIELSPFGNMQPPVVAKVNRFRVDEGLANGGTESSFVDFYVAFEMDHYPSGGWTQIPDEDVKPVWARESHAYFVKTRLDNREISVLVLLAKQPPELKSLPTSGE